MAFEELALGKKTNKHLTPAQLFDKAQRLTTLARNTVEEGDRLLAQAEEILGRLAAGHPVPELIRERIRKFLDHQVGVDDVNILDYMEGLDARLGLHDTQPVMLIERCLVSGNSSMPQMKISGVRVGMLNNSGLVFEGKTCNIGVYGHTRPSLDDAETDMDFGGLMTLFTVDYFRQDFIDVVSLLIEGPVSRMSPEPKYQILVGSGEINDWLHRHKGDEVCAQYYFQARMLGLAPAPIGLSEAEQRLLRQRSEREVRRNQEWFNEAKKLIPVPKAPTPALPEAVLVTETYSPAEEVTVLPTTLEKTQGDQVFDTRYMSFADISAELAAAGVVSDSSNDNPLDEIEGKVVRAQSIVLMPPERPEDESAQSLSDLLLSQGIDPNAHPDDTRTLALPYRPILVQGDK